jgi:Family of unknown function (DUF6463)
MQPHPIQTAPQRHWMGWGLVAIAGIHTAFAVLMWPQVLLSLVQRGLWNTVGLDPLTGGVVWFVFFGFVLAILGLAVRGAEKQNDVATLRQLGWGMLGLNLLGVVLMPDSGLWMCLAIAVAMVRKR